MPLQPTTQRYTCQVTTVDPTNTAGQVGFVIKGDAQERRAIVITPPVAFRWPQVGETWTVRKENDTWYLDGLLAPSTLSAIAPGDMTLNTPTGIVHVIGSLTGNDYILPRVIGGSLITGGSATFASPGATPIADIIVNHNLGRIPLYYAASPLFNGVVRNITATSNTMSLRFTMFSNTWGTSGSSPVFDNFSVHGTSFSYNWIAIG